MTEVTLEFIGEQIKRVLTEVRELRRDTGDLKTRMTMLEGAIGLLVTQIATLNSRLDRFEQRMETLP
jgi:hypothetical protein